MEENPRWRHGCHRLPRRCLRYSDSEDRGMLRFPSTLNLIMLTTGLHRLSLTGLILRRCTLDAVGLASWESPTHIKCVSENYENIQKLVSPEPLIKTLICCVLILLISLRRSQTGECQRLRLTSRLFFCSRGTTFPKRRWGRAWTGSPR